MDFIGAKLALFIGPRLLVYLRDDRPSLPWRNRWDLPGGGREGGEGPVACVLRETEEEFGLRLRHGVLRTPVLHSAGGARKRAWFFVAHLPPSLAGRVRFGSEGQFWCLMAPAEFVRTPRGIPHLQQRVARYLGMVP